MDAAGLPYTSAAVDQQFLQACSQLGNLVAQRKEFLNRAEALDAQIAALMSQRAAIAAQFQVLQANEKAAPVPVAAPAPAPVALKAAPDAHDGK